MRIIMPVLEKKGEESRLSEHFGQANYFAVYDSEKKKVELIDRTSEHIEGACTPIKEIMDHRPDAIFVLGMGFKALSIFKTLGVDVKTGHYKTVKEVIANLDKLKGFESACRHH
jgi:predicted Fe-Mo cluster-binding NifX family protein